MSRRDPIVIEDAVLIRCTVAAGAADRLMRAARDAGAAHAAVSYESPAEPGADPERERLLFIAPAEHADRISAALAAAAGRSRAGTGFVLVVPLARLTTWVAPALAARLEA